MVQPIADPHPVAHRAHRRHLYEFIRRQCTDRRTRHHGFDRGDLQRADAEWSAIDHWGPHAARGDATAAEVQRLKVDRGFSEEV